MILTREQRLLDARSVRAIGVAGVATCLLMSITRLGIPCPTSSLFGVQCPTCGITRSLMALLRGDVAQSIAYHPGGVALAAIGVMAIAAPTLLREQYAHLAITWGRSGLKTQILISMVLLVVVWQWNIQRVVPA